MKKLYIISFIMMLLAANVQNAMAQLYINEFMASNDTAFPGLLGDYADWIEIYNAGDDAVNLAGYYMSDDLADTSSWFQIPDTYPDSVTVPAHGFILFYANKADDVSVMCLNFKLKGSGEQVGLWDPNKVVIDTLTYGPQSPDTSYGRYPDGADNWVIMPVSTPGESNMYTAIVENKTNVTLSQNRPNPFRNQTTIDFNLEKRDFVTVRVYNITGQTVATLVNEELNAGNHSVVWNASNVPAGYYLYSIETSTSKVVKKATVLR